MPGITPAGAATRNPAEGGQKYRLIDCDVHPIVRGGIESLYPYMPSAWKERFVIKGGNINNAHHYMRFGHPTGHVIRADAAPTKGATGGSDPDYLRRDLLDQYAIDCCLLKGQQVANLTTMVSQPQESVVLASAFNDFFIHEWLPRDPRFRYAIGVTPQAPADAAAEVRRHGAQPGVVAVDLPLVNMLMGDRYYYPIYEAAVEFGLPIVLHVSGTEGKFQGAPTFAGGYPATYAERYVSTVELATGNLASLVFEGVFERYPDLRVVFVEWGFSWVLPLLWRMDKAWQQLRLETPWVKKSPSEYVHDHVRFTTQPVDEPDDPTDLVQMIEKHLSDLLLYSTDYPHWDNDLPGTVLQQLKPETKARILAGNAVQTFRL